MNYIIHLLIFLYVSTGFFIGVDTYEHKIGKALGGLFYSVFWLPSLVASIILGINNKYS